MDSTSDRLGEGSKKAIGDWAIGRVTKKVRCRPEKSFDTVDLIVDDRGMKVNEPSMVSWKDKLLGSSVDGNSSQMDEEFNLLKRDARMVMVDGIPSILFSDKVH